MSASLSHAVVVARATTSGSLTSRQQFMVLDRLLTLALEPLVAETDVFLAWVAEVLEGTIKSRRKNASTMMRACSAVLSNAPNGIGQLVEAGWDRGQAFALLDNVRQIHATMVDADAAILAGRAGPEHHAALRAARVQLGESPRLVPALATSAFWHDHAVAWRNHIVDHYLRLLFKGSVGISRASGGRIEVDPTFHEAWIAATRSANRFCSSRATFGSAYLGNALKGTYRIAASNALGLAAPGARVRSDDALQTTALEGALELEDQSHASHGQADPITLRAVAAIARDPDVRLALMVSDLSPAEALASIGRGPDATTGSTTPGRNQPGEPS